MAALEKQLARYKTLVISGGSSGIGQNFIEQFQLLDSKIKICNLSRSETEFFTKNSNIQHFSADFSDPDSFSQAREALLAYLKLNHTEGELLLVNNSGFGSFDLFDETQLENDVAMIDVNVKAPVVLTSSLWPVLQKFGGTVVNVSSIAGFQPTPFFINYGATKAYLNSWSLGMWRETLGSKVNVVTVCPGPVKTAFFKHSGYQNAPEDGNGMAVETVVRQMLHAIAKRRPLLINGIGNRIVSTVARILPVSWVTYFAYDRIKKMNFEQFR